MALDLTTEQKETGKANFQRTTEELSRRGFMKSMVVGGAAVAVAAPAAYFGYKSTEGKPVKAALIGGGDEGGVLINEHNPEFLKIVAVCDIRPSNMRRAFEGDPKNRVARKGLTAVYGKDEVKSINRYTDIKAMLEAEKDLEAVVIALPLHLHAPVAVDCMKYGQQRGKPIHVLCEKLMAWNIGECKKMIKVAKQTGSILSIGHQRHYSMLYAHAVEVLKSGVLGDIKHIRALWHRNNSWPWSPNPSDPPLALDVVQPYYRDGWFPPILAEDYDALKEKVKPYGYDDVEQLVRWRTDNMTGGGLMAELGSHQLDACGIFLGHVHPLAVSAVGGKFFYGPKRNDRDSDDHVFVTYEYPGKNHPKGPNKGGKDDSDIVVVTYSSINTNGFEAYGECVMGTRGSMVVEMEQSVLLYPEKEPGKGGATPAKGMQTGVTSGGGGKPALDTGGTWGPGGAAGVQAAAGSVAASGPVSRGYREEMEDFAYCVRQWDAKRGYEQKDGKYEQRLPRCHGEIAMADAIVALTANHSMKKRERIEFSEEWFKADSTLVPDDPKVQPKVPAQA